MPKGATSELPVEVTAALGSRHLDLESHAPLYKRKGLLAEAKREVRDVWRHRHLVRYLVRATLRKETTGTVLGFLWWLLDPLLLMGVYILLVGIILNRGGPNFALFVLASLVAWKHFSSACGTAMGTTLAREPLMRQIAFPRSVIPLAAVLATTIQLFFGLVMLVAVAVAFGIYPSIYVPAVLGVVAIQLLFALGFAFALAAANFFFRDVQPFMSHAFRFWFYLSPGLYALSAVPKRYLKVYEVNPFAYILPAYRSVVLDRSLPPLAPLGFVACAGVVVMVAGFLIFVKLENSFTKVS